MTAHKAVYLECDSCGDPSSDNVTPTAKSIREARADAKAEGWAFRQGKDICDWCLDEAP